MTEQVSRAIGSIWRIEAPRLIGRLMRMTGELGRAEDLAHEAVAQALVRWPSTGVPDNPFAWLMATARNLAIDDIRHRQMMARKHEQLEHQTMVEDEGEAKVDDVLSLILVACHPVLSRESRVALTLRLVAGLSTAEVARAFLASEATMAQRLVRAKRTLAEAKVPFEVPAGSELEARVGSVLEVIYLVFNEGYAATRGEDLIRHSLCEEAMRLGRMMVALVPADAEAHGLIALMELQASRARTRVDRNGEVVLLMDQDRSRWDRLLIARGLAALERAEHLARPLGPYTLQAAIAACHARARRAEQTDWARIVALYDGLVELTGSPVVALNRAVAVGMAFSVSEALDLVEELAQALSDYHLFHAARADLLIKLGRSGEAEDSLSRAIDLATNVRERRLLEQRRDRLRGPSD